MNGETIYINDYKNTEEYKQLKTKCWEAANNNQPLDISDQKPPEYKYFTELYYLYCAFKQGLITMEKAEQQDAKNYREYTNYADAHLEWLHYCSIFQEYTRRASTLLFSIDKADSFKAAAWYAFEVISAMTGDHGELVKRMKNKYQEEAL